MNRIVMYLANGELLVSKENIEGIIRKCGETGIPVANTLVVLGKNKVVEYLGSEEGFGGSISSWSDEVAKEELDSEKDRIVIIAGDSTLAQELLQYAIDERKEIVFQNIN